MAISNQFLRSGVTFGLDNDMDGIADSGVFPYLERIGRDGADGFMTAVVGVYDTAEPDAASDLGQYFLRTSAVNPANTIEPLLISYQNPVKSASGEIWDIDATTVDYEQWRVEALNANAQIITNILSPAGIYYDDPASLDGLPWSFEISAPDQEGISALRLVYCGNRPEYIGLAFNNFSPSQRLGTTNIVGEVRVCSATEIFWHSAINKMYQVQWTEGLGGQWHDLGPVVAGTGVEISVMDRRRGSKNRLYRVLEID